MYGRKYQWIIVGMYRDRWWEDKERETNTTCSNNELIEAMEGHFTTDVLPLSSSENITVSGLVSWIYWQLIQVNCLSRAPIGNDSPIMAIIAIPVRWNRKKFREISKCHWFLPYKNFTR